MKNGTRKTIMKQFIHYLENVSNVKEIENWEIIKDLVIEGEKEQIADAFITGQFRNMFGGGHWTNYYNQTYEK